MARTTGEWIAAVAKMRGYVKTYLSLKGDLNARQTAALATDLATLDKNLAALAESLTESTEYVALGPDPLPNNAQPLPEGFSYEDTGVVEAEYVAKHGVTPQQAANQAFTAVLRPDPNAWANITDIAVRDDLRAHDAIDQRAAIAYLAGETPWFMIRGSLGLTNEDLGAIDISQIEDLGA